MKLRTKIAGTLALPLALAVAANANAANITDNFKVGGFIAATADWTLYDEAAGQDSDVDFGVGLGTSRLNFTYQKDGVTVFYENDWAGSGRNAVNGDPAKGSIGGNEYRLRHAVISYNGWKAGYTWSGFANLTGLAETIDPAGPTAYSAYANRTASAGKTLQLADGVSLGLFVEDNSHGLNTDGTTKGRKNNTALPDVVVNFNGDFGMAKTFAAVRLAQLDSTKAGNTKAETEMAVDFTLGTSINLTDAFNVKLAVTAMDGNKDFAKHADKDDYGNNAHGRSHDGYNIGAQLGLGYKISDQIRTNLVVENVMRDDEDADSTAVWLNGFYKQNNGWEWGAELRYVAAYDCFSAKEVSDAGLPASAQQKVAGLGDKDMRISLLAKYAF